MPARKATSSLPFSHAFGDALELMKSMWRMAGLPGAPGAGDLARMAARLPQAMAANVIAPMLDLDELDKRIADLRAVEHWLQLNAGLLRTTIHGLEVQRATLAALRQVGGAMPAPSSGERAAAASAHRAGKRGRHATPQQAPGASDAPLNPLAWWNTLQDQFAKIAAAAAGADGGAAPQKPRGTRRATPRKT